MNKSRGIKAVAALLIAASALGGAASAVSVQAAYIKGGQNGTYWK